VVAKECHIRAGWGRRQGPGIKYFWFKILYMLASLAVFVVLIGIPAGIAFFAGWFTNPKGHLAPLILGGLFLFLVVMVVGLVSIVIHVFTKDFVIPQMALEGGSVFDGWRRLWPMMKAEKGDYFLYVVMKVVLAIGAGIVVGIVTVILSLFIAVPAILIGVIAAITGQSAGLEWNAYTITVAIVAGSVVFAVFFYLISLISVPVSVFFPAYSMYFFGARYPTLGAVMYPAPPAPAVAPSWPPPPPGKPPLPPAPSPAG